MDAIALNQWKGLANKIEQVLNYQTRWSRFDSVTGEADARRNINDECGYPETGAITLDHYREMYERLSIAKKVVDILPRHCWQVHPEVYEDEDPEVETAFEVAIKELGDSLRGESWYQDDEGDPVWEYLSRIDRLCGIGHYGVLLLGIGGAEGQKLGEPLEFGKGGKTRELIYLRAFPEYLAPIAEFDQDPASPRYGLPSRYTLCFDDTIDIRTDSTMPVRTQAVDVHWTRVLHIVDEVGSNEVYHTPRMRPVFNNLVDLRKLYGGSAEMYWQGAFPGLSFETHPQLGGDVEIDIAALRTQMENYVNGLQRYLSTSGMHINPMAPMVSDPSAQINIQIEAICMEKDCPKRIFIGSERGELASSQDQQHWNNIITARRNQHLTPKLIVPFVNRLILLGVLPQPEGFSVTWPTIETLNANEKADIAVKLTQAIAAFIQADGTQVLPLMSFLTMVLGFDREEALEIVEEVEKMNEAEQAKEEEEAAAFEEEAAKAAEAMPPGEEGEEEPPAGGKPPFGKPPVGKKPIMPIPPAKKERLRTTPAATEKK